MTSPSHPQHSLPALALFCILALLLCPLPAEAAGHAAAQEKHAMDLQQLINRRNELLRRKDELVRKIERERQHTPGRQHGSTRPGKHAYHPSRDKQPYPKKSVLAAMQEFQHELDEMERSGQTPPDPSMKELKSIVQELHKIEEQIRKASPAKELSLRD